MIDAHGAPLPPRTVAAAVRVQPPGVGPRHHDLGGAVRRTVSTALPGTTPHRDPHPWAAEPGPTLGDLVDAALAQRPGAWEDLVERMYNVVYRYALARLGDASAAEEVTQEVFIASTRSLHTLRTRNETATRAWFLRIAAFRVTDRIRKKSADARWRPEVVELVDDPEDMVLRRHRAAEVRAAIETLTREQREVLLRRFVLQESLQEVAAATRRPVGAVKSLQHRALNTLSRILRPETADA